MYWGVLIAALLLIVWAANREYPGVSGVKETAAVYGWYRVHPHFPRSDAAATLLALLDRRGALLLDRIHRTYIDTPRRWTPAGAAAARLGSRYDPNTLAENAPGVDGTAFTVNKGDLIAMCLREAGPGKPLLATRDGYAPADILTFVYFHELAHVAADEYGHGPEFWATFKWILQQAQAEGISGASLNFAARPTVYCGSPVDHNPLYDPHITALSG